MNKVLVTGGAGFIGSNYVDYAIKSHADLQVVNLDALTYAGNLANLESLDGNEQHTFVHGSITDLGCLEKLFQEHRFEAVLNFAAESHVDRSIHFGVTEFIQTNIQGTQNLIDVSNKYKVPRYLQVSTDEVYGSLADGSRFTEQTPLAPNNPYSATKAGADCLVRAAGNSHDMDVVITRCSNNFGPRQFPEKLIPLIIANARADKKLPVYGDGMQVRDWIYVEDHCSAIDMVLRKGRSGEVYNIGGMYDVPNLEIIKQILSVLNKPENLIEFVTDRPGHDRRYAMDNTKVSSELGWSPKYSFQEGLSLTVDWYLNNATWLAGIQSGAYLKYIDDLYLNR